MIYVILSVLFGFQFQTTFMYALLNLCFYNILPLCLVSIMMNYINC